MSFPTLTIRGKLIFTSVTSLGLVAALIFSGWVGFLHDEDMKRVNALLDNQAISLQLTLRAINELVVTEGTSTASKEMAQKGLADFSQALDEIEAMVSNDQTRDDFKKLHEEWDDFSQDVKQFAARRSISISDDEDMVALGRLTRKAEAIDEDVNTIATATRQIVQTVLRTTAGVIIALMVLMSAVLVASLSGSTAPSTGRSMPASSTRPN